jgi:hypothetical protein
LNPPHLALDIAISIEPNGDLVCAGWQLIAEQLRLAQGSASDEQRERLAIREQPREPPAKCPVSAQD